MKRNLILRRISQTPFCSKSTERNQKFTLSRCWQNCGVRKSNQLNTKRFIFFQQKQERLFRIGPCWYLILLHDTKDKTTDFFSLCFFPSMQSRGAYMQFDSWDLRHWYITVFHIHGQISQHCVCVFHLNSCARRARRSKIVDFSFVVSDCVKIFHIIAAKFVCLGILQLFCAAKIQENAKCISDKSAGNCGGGDVVGFCEPTTLQQATTLSRVDSRYSRFVILMKEERAIAMAKAIDFFWSISWGGVWLWNQKSLLSLMSSGYLLWLVAWTLTLISNFRLLCFCLRNDIQFYLCQKTASESYLLDPLEHKKFNSSCRFE